MAFLTFLTVSGSIIGGVGANSSTGVACLTAGSGAFGAGRSISLGAGSSFSRTFCSGFFATGVGVLATGTTAGVGDSSPLFHATKPPTAATTANMPNATTPAITQKMRREGAADGEATGAGKRFAGGENGAGMRLLAGPDSLVNRHGPCWPSSRGRLVGLRFGRQGRDFQSLMTTAAAHRLAVRLVRKLQGCFAVGARYAHGHGDISKTRCRRLKVLSQRRQIPVWLIDD